MRVFIVELAIQGLPASSLHSSLFRKKTVQWLGPGIERGRRVRLSHPIACLVWLLSYLRLTLYTAAIVANKKMAAPAPIPMNMYVSRQHVKLNSI